MPPNNLTLWGNEKTMNLNPLVLTNIQASPYFKVKLYEIKTYHGVIDEIYYRVSHLEPWEKGSRRTAGQTGMCGGVRGVGAGGIVSSAFCLLYKLLTLKLTRKQLIGLMNHADSPYIRGLGFMYIRFTQPPQDLYSWYEEYLDDEEEIDVRAGGGCIMTVGEMLRQWLTKLEWFSTLFPRIPVPIQKDIEIKMKALGPLKRVSQYEDETTNQPAQDDISFGEAERYSQRRSRSPRRRSPQSSHPNRRSSPHRRHSPPHRPSPPRRRPSPDDFTRQLDRERNRQRDSKSYDYQKNHNSSRHHKRHRSHSRSHDRHKRSRSSSRDHKRH